MIGVCDNRLRRYFCSAYPDDRQHVDLDDGLEEPNPNPATLTPLHLLDCRVRRHP